MYSFKDLSRLSKRFQEKLRGSSFQSLAKSSRISVRNYSSSFSFSAGFLIGNFQIKFFSILSSDYDHQFFFRIFFFFFSFSFFFFRILGGSGGGRGKEGIRRDTRRAKIPDIFLFVLLVDANVITVGFQFVVRQLAQHFEIGRKVQLQTALFQIVIPDPDQRVEELGIDRFDVFGGELLVQHPLVEGQRERRVDEPSVIQSLQTRNRTNGVVIDSSFHLCSPLST